MPDILVKVDYDPEIAIDSLTPGMCVDGEDITMEMIDRMMANFLELQKLDYEPAVKYSHDGFDEGTEAIGIGWIKALEKVKDEKGRIWMRIRPDITLEELELKKRDGTSVIIKPREQMLNGTLKYNSAEFYEDITMFGKTWDWVLTGVAVLPPAPPIEWPAVPGAKVKKIAASMAVEGGTMHKARLRKLSVDNLSEDAANTITQEAEAHAEQAGEGEGEAVTMEEVVVMVNNIMTALEDLGARLAAVEDQLAGGEGDGEGEGEGDGADTGVEGDGMNAGEQRNQGEEGEDSPEKRILNLAHGKNPVLTPAQAVTLSARVGKMKSKESKLAFIELVSALPELDLGERMLGRKKSVGGDPAGKDPGDKSAGKGRKKYAGLSMEDLNKKRNLFLQKFIDSGKATTRSQAIGLSRKEDPELWENPTE